MWVANCFPTAGQGATVVRVDAKTMKFEATWLIPGGADFYRGLAHGAGSLWVGLPASDAVTRLDPETGAKRSIPLAREAGALAWSEGYDELWMPTSSPEASRACAPQPRT